MSQKPRIITTSLENWCDSATNAISSAVQSYIKTKGECSLMLTGGKTAKQLYQHWAVTKPWDNRNVRYYFGDERCVPPDHEDSNYGMVVMTLFSNGISKDCSLNRMEGELTDREVVAKNYEQMLPDSIDVLLMSVGIDGYIA